MVSRAPPGDNASASSPPPEARIDAVVADVPSRDSSERRSRWRGIVGSLLLHAIVIGLILAIWQPSELPTLQMIRVAVITAGSGGAAGASGGSGGGSVERGPESGTPSVAAAAGSPSEPEAAPRETSESPPEPSPPTVAETAQEATPPAPEPVPVVTPAPSRSAAIAQPRPHPKPKPAAKPVAQRAPPSRVPPAPPTRQAVAQPSTVPPAPTAAEPPSQAAPAQTATGPTPAETPGTPGSGASSAEGAGRGLGVQGGGRGVAGSGDNHGTDDDYLERVRRHIKRFMTYPDVEREKKREGDGRVAVRITRDGVVLEASIERSSGYPVLDEALLKAVHDASPVPPVPDRYPGDRFKFAMPFNYQLGFFDKVLR